jgi:hypothetical protein
MERELERLRGLEEPELRLKMNRVEFLRDRVGQLDERCRKLGTQKHALKADIRVLGRVAELVSASTLAMSNLKEREVFKDKVATLGAVSQLMFDMTLLIEKALVQE